MRTRQFRRSVWRDRASAAARRTSHCTAGIIGVSRMTSSTPRTEMATGTDCPPASRSCRLPVSVAEVHARRDANDQAEDCEEDGKTIEITQRKGPPRKRRRSERGVKKGAKKHLPAKKIAKKSSAKKKVVKTVPKKSAARPRTSKPASSKHSRGNSPCRRRLNRQANLHRSRRRWCRRRRPRLERLSRSQA